MARVNDCMQVVQQRRLLSDKMFFCKGGAAMISKSVLVQLCLTTAVIAQSGAAMAVRDFVVVIV